MSVLTSSVPTAPHISATNQNLIKSRPKRGARFSNFYPQPPAEGPSLSAIDSAFQLQEYISQVIRKDPHNVDAIVTIPEKQKALSNEDGKDEISEDASASSDDNKEANSKTEYAVDESCWIYEQLRRLAQDLTHPLIVLLQQECSRSSCPEMKAGEWMYLCVAHGNDGAMEQCCAIDYILHTLDSATALLNSPRAFPSRLQIPSASTRHFPSLARRLGRIFAHAYCHHREAFETAEAENSLYARFLALSSKFNLVPSEFLTVPGGPNSAGPSLGVAAPPPASPSSSSRADSDLFAKDNVRKADGLGKMFSDFNPPNSTVEYDNTSRHNERKDSGYPPPGAVAGFGPSFSPGISTLTRPLDPEKAELGRTNALKNAVSANTRKVGRNRTDTMVYSDAYAQAYLNSGNGYWTSPDNIDSEAQNRASSVEETDDKAPIQADITANGSDSQGIPLLSQIEKASDDQEDKVNDTRMEEEKCDLNEEEILEETIDPHAEVDIVDDASIVIAFDEVQHEDREEAKNTEDQSQLTETEIDHGPDEFEDSTKSAYANRVIDHDYINEDQLLTSLKRKTEEVVNTPETVPVDISDTLADVELPSSSSSNEDDTVPLSKTSSTGNVIDTMDTNSVDSLVSDPSESTSKDESPPINPTNTEQEELSNNNEDLSDERLGFPNVSNLIQLSDGSGQQCIPDDRLAPLANTSEVDGSSVEIITDEEKSRDDIFRELPNIADLKILSNDKAESCQVLDNLGEEKTQLEEEHVDLPTFENLTLLSKSGQMCVADVDDEAPIAVKTETEAPTAENDIDSSGYVVLDKSDECKDKAEEGNST